MTTYETLYQGSDNIFMPKYVTSKYETNAGSLGMSLDPRTANQLSEINTKINPGIKHIEVSAISPEVMDSIPDIHLDEMRRLSQLTGVSTSLHAPIIEASGVGQKGGWEESNRIGAERQLSSSLIRAHRLDPKGNVSVTVHSTAQLPELITKIKVDGEQKTTGMLIINPETGKITTIEDQKKFFPKEGEKGGIFDAEKPRKFNTAEELDKINKDTWTSEVSDINRQVTYGQDILERVKKNYPVPEDLYKEIARGVDVNELEYEGDKEIFKDIQRDIVHGQIYLKGAYRELQKVFDNAYQNALKDNNKEDIYKLKRYAEDITPMIKTGIDQDPQALSEVLEKGIKVLNEIKETPKIWREMNDFVIDQAAKSYGNAATAAYKEFHDTAPVLNIENPPAGQGLSRGEDLKNLVEASRKVVVENLKKDGMSDSEAKQAAKKLIGATWDVGHINMIRKMGYSEQDVVEETRKIAPFVNHVHLSDNFGLDHTELPMGMGNVPLKQMMEKLGEKGFEGKKIIEAGNWWQHFADKGGGNPFKPSLEGMNSPIYSIGAAPYWSTPPTFGAYYMGHGPINPAVHHRLYGSGFENLPLELGGEIQGERGRFSGTPNA